MTIDFIYKTGEIVSYPVLTDSNCKRKMEIKGSRIYHYPKGDYIQYFFDGHKEKTELPDEKGTLQGLTDWLVHDMQQNVSNDYDNLVVICGAEGTGKSNLGVDVCKSYDPSFTLEERYIYDFLPFLKKLQADFNEPGNGRAYLLDEATNLVSNRDWNKDENKHMIQLLEMFRSRGLTLVLCIPSFDRLDKYIREFRARFILECYDLPQGNRFGGRGYYKLKICKDNLTVGIGTFPEMSSEDKKIYEKLKLRSQETKLNEMIQAADPDNDGKGERLAKSSERNKKMARWFYEHEGWSNKEISEQFGIPEGTLRKWKQEDWE